MSVLEQALEKLQSEYKTAKADRYGSVVKKPLLEVLCDFCRQDMEFAQAVVQGGSFEEALKASVKGAQNHTPDAQIYRQAVQYYFPGADIRVTMTVDLCAGVRDGSEPETGKKAVLLDLADFL